MTVTRSDLRTVTLAAVRATVPLSELPAFYDSAYQKVGEAAHAEGWVLAGPAVGWFHAMSSESVDLSAGFPVRAVAPGSASGDVGVVELPGGPALTLTHTGGYDGLPGAWERLEQERAAAGMQARGDFLEEYLTEPTSDGDPAANVTRLVLLLADQVEPVPE